MSRITVENLEYLFERQDKLEFFESMLAAAKHTAELCGRPFDGCAQNVKRLDAKVEEQQGEYDSIFAYIFKKPL